MDVFTIVILSLNLVTALAIIFFDMQKPKETILWLLIIFAFPLVGIVLYSIFGTTLRIKINYGLHSKNIHKIYKEVLKQHLKHLDADKSLLSDLDEVQLQNILFNLNYENSILTQNNEVSIITSGEEKYEKMFADIAAAKETVHVLYYAIHNDDTGRRLLKILREKAKQGVKVRVLFDRQGSMLSRPMFWKLRSSGGEAVALKNFFTHYRNHRKIVVIDGEIAYTGGMNIGNKYLGKNKRKTPWRDTQIRLTGEAVALLQYYFLYDWFCAKRYKEKDLKKFENENIINASEVESPLKCQIIGSGVDDNQERMKMSYLKMISSAKEKIVIQTPYFVPDETLLKTLQIAASSGVEIVLNMPGQKSNFFLQPTSNYFISKLLPYGLKVFKYSGYIHAKTLTIDNSITAIGSVNMDIRSLEIDDEICAVFYDKELVERHNEILAKDLENSVELDYEAFKKRNLWEKFKEQIFVIFSPLM